MPKASLPSISELAGLYLQLARMEDAGMSHTQAFNCLIETGYPHSAKLYKAINYLQPG